MISRVASSCFWLNRYIERVEVLARMLDVNVTFQLDVELGEGDRWRPLTIVTGQQAHYSTLGGSDDAEVVQEYLTWNRANPSSIASSLAAARENARTIRETISLEMWETVNDFWLWFNDRAARRSYDGDRQDFYAKVKNRCLLFHGVAEATMLHDEPFRFMRLGTTLERAGQTARVLDVKHHSIGPDQTDIESPSEVAQWLATLRFCSGVEPFFKRVELGLSGRAVAEFLLFDPAFPRSVGCNLERSKNLLRLIRDGSPIGERSQAELERMLARLAELAAHPDRMGDLHQLFTWIVDSTVHVGELIRSEFFEPVVRAS